MSLTRVNGWARPTDAANASVTGRSLTHYTVTLAGLYEFGNGTVKNYAAVDSDYEKIVRAIQSVGSIELLGAPQSGNIFHVAISGAAPSPSTGAASLQAYCNTYTGGGGVSGTTVAAFTY